MSKVFAVCAASAIVALYACGGSTKAADREPVPEPGAPVFRIGFGSCLHQSRPQPVWKPVLALKPDVFVLLGDNIYADTNSIAVKRRAYAKLARKPGFRKLRRTAKVIATWDDHDYGYNDIGASYRSKRGSRRLFLNFFRGRKYTAARKEPGIYESYLYGPPERRVQVILLDTRYFRGSLKRPDQEHPYKRVYPPNTGPGATMLGERQWRWLERQLRVPARVRILATSIQAIPRDHTGERWAAFPRERERLLRVLRDSGASGLILISGDRHYAEMSVLRDALKYPLYEFTSSGLTETWDYGASEPNRHRVPGSGAYPVVNFGMVKITWGRSPVIQVRVRDVEGKVLLRKSLRLSSLRADG